MHALLVFLSAVLAAAMARPGQLLAVQPPVPDAASSKAPTARANSDQEASDDDINPAHTGRGLQNPVVGTFKTSGPVNPTLPNNFPASDGADESTRTLFVDNPHIGLPFGTVLPLPNPNVRPQVIPTSSTAGTSTTFIVDSPHVGLPANSFTPDAPSSTTAVNSPVSTFQTGASSDNAFGSSLYNILKEFPSKSDGVSNLPNSPTSITVNRGASNLGTLPKSQFANSVSPILRDVFVPNSFPTHSTHIFFPVSSPVSHVPSSAGLPVKIDSASLQTSNGDIDFLVSNPVGGFFTKTEKIPTTVFTPISSQSKFFHTFPIHSATSNPPIHIPSNTVTFGFPNSRPNTNIAFTINNPPHSLSINIPTSDVPVSSPSNSLLVNSANVLLFNENVPYANVVNTPKGPVFVGGPSNFAIFPQQPSLDEINQVLAAHTAQTAPAATAATGLASSRMGAGPPPEGAFLAGVAATPGGSPFHQH